MRTSEQARDSLFDDVVVLWPYLHITERFQWLDALMPLYHIPAIEIAGMIEKRISGHP
jgi:hypothetical protein